MLRIEQLGRRQGSVQVLENLEFSWPGGLLAILGGNGAGKSTLLRIVAGALAPTTGRASWNGLPTAKVAKQTGKVGYAPQERNLDLDITLRELLSLCADLRGLSGRAGHVATVAEELGLDPQLDELLTTMSGGGRRKAMTAQALLGSPELIVLDEPTSEVDYAASRRFWEVFKARSRSAAVLVATHDVEAAREAADAILLLDRRGPMELRAAGAFGVQELAAVIAGA